MSGPGSLVVRPAGPDDVATVLGLYDEAVARLVARGLTEQWGDRPWSELSHRRALVEGWCTGGGSHLATTPDGAPAGHTHLGEAPAYVAPADVPEVYVVGLVASSRPEARGAGRLLLEHAVTTARAGGAAQVRVDCFAGNGGRLVAFYRSCGFTPADHFTVGDWRGRVLVQRLG